MQRIRAITLDLDDTLWEIGPVIHRAEAKLWQWLADNYPRISTNYSATDVLNIRVSVMQEYAEDDRYSTIMGRIARGYTKEEIALMADHFAGKKYMSTTQNLDAAKVAAGGELYQKNCGKCHDENGALADDDSGILASQWLPYLQYSMEDFQADKRSMPKKMKKKVKKLSAAEIEALLQFFASQK